MRCQEDTQTVLDELIANDVQIHVANIDISDAEQVTNLFCGVPKDFPEVRGIVHAAGALDDGVITQQTWERFASVYAPKVQGSWNLHLATQEMPLDFFVCFSSIASSLGAGGQSNYAGANAFMDGLMQHRQQQGLAGMSIQWGPWAKVGMAARLSAQDQQRMQAFGITPLSLEQGLSVLDHLFAQEPAHLHAVLIDWPRYQQQFGNVIPPLFEHLMQAPSDESAHPSAFIEQLQSASIAQRSAVLTQHLQQLVAQVMNFNSTDDVKTNVNIFDLGMDSLMAIELRNRLQESLSCKLPATFLFDHPNINKLREYIEQKVLKWNKKDKDNSQHNQSLVKSSTPTGTTLIAVTGTGGRFPGAPDIQTFWSNLTQGKETITFFEDSELISEVIHSPLLNNNNYIKAKPIVQDVDLFDAELFGLTPREATVLDPQQRLFLECVWEALEDAHCIPESYPG